MTCSIVPRTWANSLLSAPVAKRPPSPRRITQRRDSSCDSCRKETVSASHIETSMALSLPGFDSVTLAIAPFFSSRISGMEFIGRWSLSVGSIRHFSCCRGRRFPVCDQEQHDAKGYHRQGQHLAGRNRDARKRDVVIGNAEIFGEKARASVAKREQAAHRQARARLARV